MRSVGRLIKNLKALRVRHDLTQEEFAAISGFNYKYYQEIESGRKKQVLLETLDRLADTYGVESGAMIGDSVPRKTKLAKPALPILQKKWRKGVKSRGE